MSLDKQNHPSLRTTDYKNPMIKIQQCRSHNVWNSVKNYLAWPEQEADQKQNVSQIIETRSELIQMIKLSNKGITVTIIVFCRLKSLEMWKIFMKMPD